MADALNSDEQMRMAHLLYLGRVRFFMNAGWMGIGPKTDDDLAFFVAQHPELLLLDQPEHTENELQQWLQTMTAGGPSTVRIAFRQWLNSLIMGRYNATLEVLLRLIDDGTHPEVEANRQRIVHALAWGAEQQRQPPRQNYNVFHVAGRNNYPVYMVDGA